MPSPWTISLSGETENASHFGDWIEGVAEEAGWSKRTAFELRLLLDEALGNVFAYGSDSNVQVSVDVTLEERDGTIIAEVSDNGIAFDPTTAPRRHQPVTADEVTVGGWGIELMREKSESLEYQRIGDRNCLRMTLRV
jgi:serine/threonine-protein kinase RsbW